jgi:hypothetical protein
LRRPAIAIAGGIIIAIGGRSATTAVTTTTATVITTVVIATGTKRQLTLIDFGVRHLAFAQAEASFFHA